MIAPIDRVHGVVINTEILIILWCNGSTADFGSVSLGSSPDRITNKSNINFNTFTMKSYNKVRNIIIDTLQDYSSVNLSDIDLKNVILRDVLDYTSDITIIIEDLFNKNINVIDGVNIVDEDDCLDIPIFDLIHHILQANNL